MNKKIEVNIKDKSVIIKDLTIDEQENFINNLNDKNDMMLKFGYIDDRVKEYPALSDQLDMIYHDLKNNTTHWVDLITLIKENNPKPSE